MGQNSKRILGMRHYDVQLTGGVVLHDGKIAEMRTGEGKTLVSTLPIYLNALMGKGVHVVTVNDYLAKRDAQWMGKIYDFLGLSVGVIVHDHAYLVDFNKKEDPASHKASSVAEAMDDKSADREHTLRPFDKLMAGTLRAGNAERRIRSRLKPKS